MQRILLCSANAGKLNELQKLLPSELRLVPLHEVAPVEELEETGATLQENALQKAEFGHRVSGLLSIADDSGLEVPSLNGAPGVASAAFSGARDDKANMRELLARLVDGLDRTARFRTVIAVVGQGVQRTFEGTVNGTIAPAARGTKGFGYDPIFIPEGYDRTFAEMEITEKNKISHRAKAIGAFMDWLRQQI